MKMRIAIVGVGGVGGYLGARLCHFRDPIKSYHVIFIQRGEGLLALKKNGITLITEQNKYVAFPDMVTDDPSDLGIFTHVFLCVKSYQLDDVLKLIKNNVAQNTVLISLLNGIGTEEKIKTSFPYAEILGGCVYVSSEVLYPGIVKQTGSAGKLFFGSEVSDENSHRELLDVLKNARIKAFYKKNIKRKEWEKFLILCPFSTLSSFYNCTAGEIVEDGEKNRMFVSMMKEIVALANAKGVPLDGKDVQENLTRILTFSKETKTSFQRDFKAGKNTEIDVLAGYVVEEGKKLGLKTPLHEEFFDKLNKRILNREG